MPATLASAEPRRARGRPRRLTPEAVLDAALTLFEDEPAAEFTLGRLARRLGVPITSLYTCFPNRDALLDAAADRVFARFDWKPEPRSPWTAVLLSWMHAVQRHFERYPIAQQLLTWDRRISPAWLRVLAPIITLLHAQGLVVGARMPRSRTSRRVRSACPNPAPGCCSPSACRYWRFRRWAPPSSPPTARAWAHNSNSGAT